MKRNRELIIDIISAIALLGIVFAVGFGTAFLIDKVTELTTAEANETAPILEEIEEVKEIDEKEIKEPKNENLSLAEEPEPEEIAEEDYQEEPEYYEEESEEIEYYEEEPEEETMPEHMQIAAQELQAETDAIIADAEANTMTEEGELTYIGTYQITAYEWTGDPCANGNYPALGYTVACNSLPFGTTVYIDGVGYRVVEDRGADWHSDQWIDLYLGDVDSCFNFGVQYLDVYIVE